MSRRWEHRTDPASRGEKEPRDPRTHHSRGLNDASLQQWPGSPTDLTSGITAISPPEGRWDGVVYWGRDPVDDSEAGSLPPMQPPKL